MVAKDLNRASEFARGHRRLAGWREGQFSRADAERMGLPHAHRTVRPWGRLLVVERGAALKRRAVPHKT